MALASHAHHPHLHRPAPHAFDSSPQDFRQSSSSNSWHQENSVYDGDGFRTSTWPAIFPSPPDGVYSFDASYVSPNADVPPSTPTPPFDYRSGISAFSRSPSASTYPESSQRTDLPSVPFHLSLRGLLDPHSAPTIMQPSHRTPPPWDDGLLSIDPEGSTQTEIGDASSLAVKAEPEDTFILEMGPENSVQPMQSMTPMTAPLRATHASADMRKLMGVFRLDPFTMLNGVRESPRAWQYGTDAEIGPLEEEPVMFEFQLELNEPLIPETPTDSRASSPAYSKDNASGLSHNLYLDRYHDSSKPDYESVPSQAPFSMSGMYTLGQDLVGPSFPPYLPSTTAATRGDSYSNESSLHSPLRPLSQTSYQHYADTTPFTAMYYNYQGTDEVCRLEPHTIPAACITKPQYRSGPGATYGYTPSPVTDGNDISCHSSMTRRWSVPHGV